jgi:hypothetical protein
MTESERAALIKLQKDGQEIAGLLAESVAAAAERDGRESRAADFGIAIGPLLAAAWSLARLASDSEAEARAAYTELLRRHADNIDQLAG